MNIEWRALVNHLWFLPAMMIVSLLLVVMIGTKLYGAYTFYQAVHQPVVVAAQKSSDARSVSTDAWSSLFGTWVPPDLDESSVRKTMLNLEITGIMFDEDASQSYVTIRDAGKQEKTWRVGDVLPGDIKIRKITTDGILLEHGGNLERLSFPHHELDFLPVAKPFNGASQ